MGSIRLVDLGAFAKKVLESLDVARDESATIVTLSGELGAGKTTFTQALARELGVTEVVQSPTYVLMKSYELKQGSTLESPGVAKREVEPCFTRLIHIDAYRLDAPEQFAALRPETFLSDPNALVVVEWPERLQGALPTPDLSINFSSDGVGEGERYITID